MEMLARLPRPKLMPKGGGSGGGGPTCVPQWNSVALFFNFSGGTSPAGYANTSVAAAKAFLDEGADPCSPGISESLCCYWSALSYGRLAFGLDTPRAANGDPLIPSVTVPSGGALDWGALIQKCIEANPEAVWRAAGQLTEGGKRWIPSVALIQNYDVGASAGFWGFEMSTGGHTYLIGDITHIRFGLDKWVPSDAPSKVGRSWWGTLNHEYAHNFLEFGDLYGPQGCTGYWDLLGDNSPPGRMSEVSSPIKQRVGWLEYVQVIQGPTFVAQPMKLRPYTTTGEAIKVIPDPVNTPHEYFVLEFRKSTGDEVWRPDGALADAGLFIIHINERLGIPSTWLLREAPYFDPEFADYSHRGATDWSGHDDLAHKVFPYGINNSFTPQTKPNSNLYGGRRSGVWITNIAVQGDEVRFTLELKGLQSTVAWNVSAADRALAGRFTTAATSEGEELFIRNDDHAALLVHRQAQWLVARTHDDWIGGWNLGPGDRELVGDFDGDGRDEIYIRSDDYAGIIAWQTSHFRTVTVQHDWIDQWNLGKDNWERVGDFDGDGAAEVYIRSPEWAGIIKLVAGQLRLLSIQHDWIDQWNLGKDNEEFVGAFRSAGVDEIAIRSPEWLGLLRYDGAGRCLRLVRIQHDWVDGWNLGKVDQHHVGDFDGDGLDEIYIRSPEWAGVLKWVGGRFRVLWMTQNAIPHEEGDPAYAQALTKDDRSYVGRFRTDRDGILHRHKDGVAVLLWSDGQMKVAQRLDSRFDDRWNLGADDKFVLGDFHRVGTDIVDTGLHYIVDGITDVFIHNGWGTGMIGVNPLPDRAAQFGLTWIQQGKLLADD
ncbi:hypothetical protein [Thiococcus pfennigii]|uniref:hypothetical protein n=1 Tax=Thiococcus pfennigii TaxID=1057 RepID=UPI001906FCDB|nr:hypothetical protein [Thiococcus pfennigii]MBK1730798.1 hypothetical protein [Thiococcus pfennigii]